MTIHIYVIAAHKEGPVKIGFSADPEERLKQLQTGHPEPLTLYYSLSFEKKQAKLMERIIHKTIKLHRTHGEWFDISVDSAIAEVDFALIRYGDEINLRTYL